MVLLMRLLIITLPLSLDPAPDIIFQNFIESLTREEPKQSELLVSIKVLDPKVHNTAFSPAALTAARPNC